MVSICYISTYLNHHNKPIADALYNLTKGNFYYIATSNIGEMRKNMGFSQMKADYLLDYTIPDNRDNIQEIVDKASVVLIGSSEPLRLIRQRLKQGKLTFRCSERLFKTRSRYLKAPIHWFRSFLTRKASLLCCSAASARDYNLLGFYKNRSYKWGYFTEVKKIDPKELWDEKINSKDDRSKVSILWVARMINWKHPETAVEAAKILKESGYSFDLNIIGDGPVAPQIKDMICSLDLADCVHLLGAKSAQEVRQHMEKSEIFLFTSDRQEGWGAVLNESMSCACAVVANSEIGAVPFVVEDGHNGVIYSNGSVESLVDRLKPLLESESYRRNVGTEAYYHIASSWSPIKAAENLLKLVNALQNNQSNPITNGPCSFSK